MTALRLLLTLVLAFPGVGAAETPVKDLLDAATRAAAGSPPSSASAAKGPEQDAALPSPPLQAVLEDADTRKAFLDSMRRYYAYKSSGYAYRARVFEWQLWSSRVIFVTVLLVVLAGVYLAAVQFHVALAMAKRASSAQAVATASAAPSTREEPDQNAVSLLTTQLEVSAKGIVVNSSVVGLIVLALSLIFFYLYLVYVYPILNVF